MENCKADNIPEKLFRSYWKQGKLSLCKKNLYQGLSINSCSVDVTIENALLKQQIYSKIPRSSHQRCSMKKGVRRNLTKFTESTCARIPFLSLRPATLLKKRLRRRCFPANFVKFLRTSLLQNNSGQLLLNTYCTCGAGLQSGTSPQFHFLRFSLFGTPIFRNT